MSQDNDEFGEGSTTGTGSGSGPVRRSKRIAVVIKTSNADRAAEALRAAVGLTLRGDRVSVVRVRPLPESDTRVARALGALAALGHEVDASMACVHEADAVEVWQ
jgi:hypothetical protein